MGAKDVRAGGAFIELFAKDSMVQATLLKVKKNFTDFGKQIRNVGLGSAGLGTALVAPLAASVQAFATNGAAIDDMAQRTGLTSGAVQELSHAAEMSATNVEALEKGLLKMQRTIVAAGEGTLEARKALNDMGTSFTDLKGLSPDQQLEKMADGLSKIKDPAARTAAAVAIFGKAGAELIPFLSEGSAGIEKFRAEARSLGLVLDGNAIQAAAELDDKLQTLKSSFRGVVNQIGAALAGPALTMIQLMTNGAASVAKFVQANQGLVIGIALTGAALLIAGGAMIGLGVAISTVGTILGGMAAAWGAIGAVMAAVAGSPLLLIIGGLAAVALLFPQVRQAAADAFGYLFGEFANLGGIFETTLGGIADAMSAGNLMLAAKVLWAGLNKAWLEGTANLRATYRDLVTSISKLGVDIFAGLQKAWASTVKYIGDLWDMVVGGMGGKWSDLQNTIARGLINAFAKVSGIPEADLAQSLEEEQKGQKEASAQRMKQREIESQKRMQEIEQERQESNASLDAMADAGHAAAAKQLEDAEEALRASREEAAVAKADADNRRRRDTKGKIGTGNGEDFLTGTMGTFSASAAARSAVAGVSPLQKGIDKVADNTEKTVAAVENLQELAFR
ncbi:MAG: hypothetical protein EBR82_27140 [Caulobacteraceae bacterium]|nr:hypothetical protein [Caulobacteraceae bacterium]